MKEKDKKQRARRIILLAAAFTVLVFFATRLPCSQLRQMPKAMEALTGVLVLFELYYLYRYLSVPNDHIGREEEGTPLFSRSDQRYFMASLLFYVMASVTHDRCIFLAVLYYPVLAFKLLEEEKGSRKAWLADTRYLWISPMLAAGILVLARLLAYFLR